MNSCRKSSPFASAFLGRSPGPNTCRRAARPRQPLICVQSSGGASIARGGLTSALTRCSFTSGQDPDSRPPSPYPLDSKVKGCTAAPKYHSVKVRCALRRRLATGSELLRSSDAMAGRPRDTLSGEQYSSHRRHKGHRQLGCSGACPGNIIHLTYIRYGYIVVS